MPESAYAEQNPFIHANKVENSRNTAYVSEYQIRVNAMKKCPSCKRVYSDTLTQCLVCGTNLTGEFPNGNPEVASVSQKIRDERPQMQKPVETVMEPQNKKTQKAVRRWKFAFASLLVVTLLLTFLYVSKVNDYDELQSDYRKTNKEYVSLKQKYEKFQDTAAIYGWGWRYIPLVMDYYNGTREYKRISDEVNHEDLDGICVDLKIRDDAEKWEDILYIDVLTPSGTVINPKSENDDHTWKLDLSDSQGNERDWYIWFSAGRWESGTYWLVFYQGSRIIDSFPLKVT